LNNFELTRTRTRNSNSMKFETPISITSCKSLVKLAVNYEEKTEKLNEETRPCAKRRHATYRSAEFGPPTHIGYNGIKSIKLIKLTVRGNSNIN